VYCTMNIVALVLGGRSVKFINHFSIASKSVFILKPIWFSHRFVLQTLNYDPRNSKITFL
jgi:hypothetical protein